MIRSIEHTAILATDTEALVQWNRDTLGFEILSAKKVSSRYFLGLSEGGIRKDFVRQDNNDHETGRTEVSRMNIKAFEVYVSG